MFENSNYSINLETLLSILLELVLTLSEFSLLLDDRSEYPGVSDDHDQEREEVDGGEEGEGEGGDGPGVGAERHALLVAAGRVRRRTGVPHERLSTITKCHSYTLQFFPTSHFSNLQIVVL